MVLVSAALTCPLGLLVRPAPVALNVYRVVPGSVAASVFRRGDYILTVNGAAVNHKTSLATTFRGRVTVVAWRPPAPE